MNFFWVQSGPFFTDIAFFSSHLFSHYAMHCEECWKVKINIYWDIASSSTEWFIQDFLKGYCDMHKLVLEYNVVPETPLHSILWCNGLNKPFLFVVRHIWDYFSKCDGSIHHHNSGTHVPSLNVNAISQTFFVILH